MRQELRLNECGGEEKEEGRVREHKMQSLEIFMHEYGNRAARTSLPGHTSFVEYNRVNKNNKTLVLIMSSSLTNAIVVMVLQTEGAMGRTQLI